MVHFALHPDLFSDERYARFYIKRGTRSSTLTPRKQSRGFDNESDSEVSDATVVSEDEDEIHIIEENAALKGFKKYKSVLSSTTQSLKTKAAHYTEDIIDTILVKNDNVRAFFSEPFNLYNLELVAEFLLMAAPFAHLLTLGKLFPVVESKAPYFASWPVFEASEFFKVEHIVSLSFWFATSILLPLVTSYYANFGRTGLEFDPFVFFLTKGLLYHYIALTSYSDAVVADAETLITSSRLNWIKAVFQHQGLRMQHSLGYLPFIGTGTAVLVSLYAAITA